MKNNNIKTIQEVVGVSRFDVDKVLDIKDVMNKEIVIHDFKVAKGNWGDYLVILASFDANGDKFVFTTGSEVIMKKLFICRDKNALPVRGKIVGVKKYYDII